MSENDDKDSKTEEASEKKIRDSVEKGRLPVAKEASVLASFLAILVFTMFFAQKNMADLSAFLAIFLERPDEWSLETSSDATLLFRIVFIEIAKVLAVVMALLVGGALAASFLQNTPRMVGERIKPQLSRISLKKGWERLFGVKGLVEFAKSLGKIVFASAVLFYLMRNAQTELVSGMITHPVIFNQVIADLAVRIITAITLIMVFIAVADLAWSRYSWLQDLRMSRQELKDELKQTVGDPIVRMRIRSLQRDRARQRMMAAVPTATLVIANPTHYAIALRYAREESAAPVVVAKGQDLVALKIREIAEANGIPVFEDVALARSMYKQVSMNSMIPPQFYQAVAELVRVIYERRPGGAGRVQ